MNFNIAFTLEICTFVVRVLCVSCVFFVRFTETNIQTSLNYTNLIAFL